jgi:hypothetical protein
VQRAGLPIEHAVDGECERSAAGRPTGARLRPLLTRLAVAAIASRGTIWLDDARFAILWTASHSTVAPIPFGPTQMRLTQPRRLSSEGYQLWSSAAVGLSGSYLTVMA